jgi:signal transduction histidine kinase
VGLGLTITKAITTAHGGTLEVDSAEGRGTIFTLTLPRA